MAKLVCSDTIKPPTKQQEKRTAAVEKTFLIASIAGYFGIGPPMVFASSFLCIGEIQL
jgi:hypothetical protein